MQASLRRGMIFAVVLLSGVALLLYPSVSQIWNRLAQNRVIAGYEDTLKKGEEPFAAQLAQAEAYNRRLAREGNCFSLSQSQREKFTQLLGEDGGSFGYLEIPTLDLRLPIYLGTGESVLQAGVGVLEGGSLPIGGESTHTVLTGHRGLPTATLFTHLDRLKAGDTFTLHTLGRSLRYQVEEILVVEPQEMEALELVPGEDLCTLVTCTPYGINTHRMLVQARRAEKAAKTEGTIPAGGVQIPWEWVAGVMLAGMILLAASGAVIGRQAVALRTKLRHQQKRGKQDETTA